MEERKRRAKKRQRDLRWPTSLTFLLIVIILVLMNYPRTQEKSPSTVEQHAALPNFHRIKNTEKRKAAFFKYLRPYVIEANQQIREDRSRLEQIGNRLAVVPMDKRAEQWLVEQAVRYGIVSKKEEPLPEDILEQLDLRLGEIPESLALAQAALESGWGTSRFARKGNNLFGIWCYSPGCGIIPKRRPDGETYEVTVYASPRESFLDYMNNLNSHEAYLSLWMIRKSMIMEGEELNGLKLADGLGRYSQEGETYIEKVKNLIRKNDLE